MSLQLALLIIAVGVAVGAFSAMFGVGGGVVMVPFMVFALDEGQHLAEGTSLLAIVPIAIFGALGHRRRGLVAIRPAVLVALGGIGGAIVGARLALTVDAEDLQLIFGALLVFLGFRLLVQGVQATRH
jgi:uncharacterized membrane protein YfcA